MVIPQGTTLTSALHPIHACFCSHCSRPSVSKGTCCSVQRAGTQQEQHREGMWTSSSSGSCFKHSSALVQWRGNCSEGEARISGWGQGARGISLIGFFPASSTFWALSAEGQSWRWLAALRLAVLWLGQTYTYFSTNPSNTHVHPSSVLTDL